MKLDKTMIEELRVHPGHEAHLAERPTSLETDVGKGRKREERTAADAQLHDFVEELEVAQELLYASATHAVLMVLQGLDAAGKDGTIKHVLSGVNPQGCEVTSFKQPSSTELNHDFLWRVSRALPERGRLGIFNRSHYEDVLVVRVHPELLGPGGEGAGSGRSGGSKVSDDFWHERFEDINAFERHLDRNGTRVVKFFLHLSSGEQKHRLLERLDDPSKHWKFSESDLAERQYWDRYQAAYEAAISATSTPWAPWYVVPADDKHDCRALVAGILVHTIDELDLAMPEVGPEQTKRIEAAKAQLAAE
jgi:PPK2 family polyphosphate:nucleotide phosphotransferase